MSTLDTTTKMVFENSVIGQEGDSLLREWMKIKCVVFCPSIFQINKWASNQSDAEVDENRNTSVGWKIIIFSDFRHSQHKHTIFPPKYCWHQLIQIWRRTMRGSFIRVNSPEEIVEHLTSHEIQPHAKRASILDLFCAARVWFIRVHTHFCAHCLRSFIFRLVYGICGPSKWCYST